MKEVVSMCIIYCMFQYIEHIRFVSILYQSIFFFKYFNITSTHTHMQSLENKKTWQKQLQQMNICLVFRMQHISMQVRLSQMLMNTVVTWRPAWEVICGEVLESSRSLPVYFHLVTYLLSSHWLPCWPPVLAVAYQHDSYCISFHIHLNHHFGFSALIKMERAFVVNVNTLFSLDCRPLIRQGYHTVWQVKTMS